MFRRDLSHRFDAVPSGADVVPLGSQRELEHEHDLRLIVDDEDPLTLRNAIDRIHIPSNGTERLSLDASSVPFPHSVDSPTRRPEAGAPGVMRTKSGRASASSVDPYPGAMDHLYDPRRSGYSIEPRV